MLAKHLTLLLLLFWLTVPARADDPIFPPGSRVALVPPHGFVPGKAFPGFEDREKNSLILISEFPASAYADLERRVADEQLWRQGVTVENREPFGFAGGAGFLVTGRQEAGGVLFRRWILFGSAPDFSAIVSVQVPDTEKVHSDAAVRAALATIAVRVTAPVEEQLVGLPFTLHELAGFRIMRVVPGSAVLLTAGANEIFEVTEQPLLLVSVVRGAPGAQASERDRFARGLLAETPGIKEIRLVRSEPLRIGGQQGHEIVAEAKDMKTSSDVMVAQWLRFGGNGHLRVLGLARKDGWGETFARLRAVRDGIDLR